MKNKALALRNSNGHMKTETSCESKKFVDASAVRQRCIRLGLWQEKKSWSKGSLCSKLRGGFPTPVAHRGFPHEQLAPPQATSEPVGAASRREGLLYENAKG
ncbi:hypothetical protein FNW02_03300 [Komarekiella sp. 'clone 1']|uniref:Uncharacterized protein n=1 Tax=Komarekiella delphini-convector SJRDD-AB1 TaxID=2593771 RepID=A0AA40STW7_9NOST|nr:hypothetical protein [Komarekiella delphini-convector]MBD6614902.1 hypothetical protein [Komarekiella delphini-convector SJRDD-AB1]